MHLGLHLTPFQEEEGIRWVHFLVWGREGKNHARPHVAYRSEEHTHTGSPHTYRVNLIWHFLRSYFPYPSRSSGAVYKRSLKEDAASARGRKAFFPRKRQAPESFSQNVTFE